MKKIISIASVAILALSLFVFSGCSTNKQAGLTEQIQGCWSASEGNDRIFNVIEFRDNSYRWRLQYTSDSSNTVQGSFKVDGNDIILEYNGTTYYVMKNVQIEDDGWFFYLSEHVISAKFEQISKHKFETLFNK